MFASIQGSSGIQTLFHDPDPLRAIKLQLHMIDFFYFFSSKHGPAPPFSPDSILTQQRTECVWCNGGVNLGMLQQVQDALITLAFYYLEEARLVGCSVGSLARSLLLIKKTGRVTIIKPSERPPNKRYDQRHGTRKTRGCYSSLKLRLELRLAVKKWRRNCNKQCKTERKQRSNHLSCSFLKRWQRFSAKTL